MKKLSFLMAALLVAMTGCQKEPQVTETPDVNAKHFVAVNIALPTDAGTRAKDEFENGTEGEYNVNDITLVFYDEDGNYLEAKNVDSQPWNPEGTTTDNITSKKSTGAIAVQNANIKQVLVILNNKNGENLRITYTNKTYTELTTAIENITDIAAVASVNNFLMTNAPKYNTDGTFSYLVSIQTYTSETDAVASPATVQVERAAAKVEVRYTGANKSYEVAGYFPNDEENSKVTFTGWDLDITNKTYFPVRKCQDYGVDQDWWEAVNTFVNPGINGTRTYFAVDPNYADVDVDAVDFNRLTTITDDDHAVKYCLENTFNTECMRQKQSTRVILKAQFIPAGIVKADADTWDPETDATWYMVGDTKTPYTPAALEEKLGSPLTGITFDENNHYKHATLGDIYKYAEGACYYPVIIRHFNLNELNNAYTTEADYLQNFENNNGQYAECDLGRYGVVRNNWYRLNINSVSQPGEPVIPDPEDATDDVVKRYLACDIEILSWCTRDQSVDL